MQKALNLLLALVERHVHLVEKDEREGCERSAIHGRAELIGSGEEMKITTFLPVSIHTAS